MTYAVRIYPAADADIDEAALHIAQDSEEHALRLYDAVETTFERLRKQPNAWPLCELGHPGLQGVRRCCVSGFRIYLVFYRVEGSVVEIIRVLHGARDVPAVLHDELMRGSV